MQYVFFHLCKLIVAMLDDPEKFPEARLFPSTVIERSTLKPRLDSLVGVNAD